MLSQYFGFHEEPFGITPDLRYLYPSQTHLEALAALEYGILNNRGFTAMIAPPGMGKTTLLFRLLKDIRETSRSIFVFDISPECEPRELLGYILRDMGITPGNSSSEMHQQFSEALTRETRAGRKLVIVIDEAQNLSDAVLERVRLLTNFETSTGKLVQMVLSGQPQLSDKLLQPSLLQLRQRISAFCRLEPLSAEETIGYIDYRLKQAGYEGNPLFTDGALKLIVDASQGTPRTINNLCFNALSLCRALNGKQVDADMVSEVIADLQLTPQSIQSVAAAATLSEKTLPDLEEGDQPRRLIQYWALAATAMLAICVLGVIWFTELRPHQSSRSVDAHTLDHSTLSLPTPVPTPAPVAAPFEITIESNQNLQNIAMKYLGGFDPERLRQIQALNPNLTDPNFIVAGRKMWLPGPPVAKAVRSPALPSNVEKHQ